MTFETQTDPELLLILAKAGYGPAPVRLLELYRDPLAEQARHQVGRRLRVKLDVEDILQEVSLEVYRDIGKFRGSTTGEFLCWLRKILGTILLNQVRHYFGTSRRNLRQERRIGYIGESAEDLVLDPIAPDTSPSQQRRPARARTATGRRDRDLADAVSRGDRPAAHEGAQLLGGRPADGPHRGQRQEHVGPRATPTSCPVREPAMSEDNGERAAGPTTSIPADTPGSRDDPRVASVLAAYLAELEAGRRPSRAEAAW